MSKINVDSLAVLAFSVAITGDGTLRHDGVNDILCQISGLTKEMFIGKTAAEFMSFEGAQAWEANYRRCLASGAMDEYEEWAETPSGLRWWRTILSPVVDETGKIIQLLGLAADITIEGGPRLSFRPLSSMTQRRASATAASSISISPQPWPNCWIAVFHSP